VDKWLCPALDAGFFIFGGTSVPLKIKLEGWVA